MFTCFIRYTVDPDKLPEFEEYARAWIPLIQEHGGTHHGYFLPGTDESPEATFSFPGLGTNGPDNIAVALFSFPDVATYHQYREAVATDPRCLQATERFHQTRCFTSYERTFLRPILPPAATFIKLDQFLKWKGLVSTGGEARALIRDGGVRVNGEIETRRGRKLHDGDRVQVGEQTHACDLSHGETQGSPFEL